MPRNPGRLIFQHSCVMTARLLTSHDFVKHCKDRNLAIDSDRLVQLERLGIFTPIVRFIETGNEEERLHLPSEAVSEWFECGRLIDTATFTSNKELASSTEARSSAYYSVFQIDQLSIALNETTLNLHLESFLNDPSGFRAASRNIEKHIELLRGITRDTPSNEFRRAIPILCQFIANRYYPRTQGNQRTINVSRETSLDEWMMIDGHNWDWWEYSKSFNPKMVEELFSLTPEILEHAYETLGMSACFSDPLDDWSNLVEFVSVRKKQSLKGDALRAQSMKDAANMLRLLHKDLYDEELPPPHQIAATVINHFPELEVRDDKRRHLEYVVNQYDLNPQPKVVLFVEGESEVRLIHTVFRDCFGHHPGNSGIEIINLQGVNNATGNKRADRFRAIFRLADYLHHHQSIAFLLLDRENQAQKLKDAARDSISLHGQNRLAVQNQHIHLWKINLEFDNFSDTEIAAAMTTIAENKTKFTQPELRSARSSSDPGKEISNLYRSKTGHGLRKPKLVELLAEMLVNPTSRRAPKNRPIVRVLTKIRRLAARNPFPTQEKTWLTNQASPLLGGKRKVRM